MCNVDMICVCLTATISICHLNCVPAHIHLPVCPFQCFCDYFVCFFVVSVTGCICHFHFLSVCFLVGGYLSNVACICPMFTSLISKSLLVNILNCSYHHQLSDAQNKLDSFEHILQTKEEEAEDVKTKISKILEMGDAHEENESLKVSLSVGIQVV